VASTDAAGSEGLQDQPIGELLKRLATETSTLLILVLDEAMPSWLAALIVTAVYGAAAAVLYVRGKERVENAGSPVPRQTVETLKEDMEWAKHPTTSARR
jgi:hypothetical protein